MVTPWAAFPRARTLRRASLIRPLLVGLALQPPRRESVAPGVLIGWFAVSLPLQEGRACQPAPIGSESPRFPSDGVVEWTLFPRSCAWACFSRRAEAVGQRPIAFMAPFVCQRSRSVVGDLLLSIRRQFEAPPASVHRFAYVGRRSADRS